MLGVLLALAAAISYSASDYAAGLAARAASVIRVTVVAQVVNAALLLPVIAIVSTGRLTGTALAWGSVAGVSGVIGTLALYLGFRHAAFSVASSISAVSSAAFAVLAGLLLGERPGPLELVGIALALPAIAAVSAGQGVPASAGQGAVGQGRDAQADNRQSTGQQTTGRQSTGRQAAGVGWGLLAGAAIGLFFIGLNRAGSGTDLWPLGVAEVTAVAAILVLAAGTRQLALPPGARWLSVLTGFTAAAGTLTYFLATHHGLLATTAVLTTLYPAGTILLARALLGERITPLRLAGLCLAGASVGLIAAAGVR